MTRIDWTNPNAPVSRYFKVKDVTQGDPRRIPTNPLVKRRIKQLAAKLDKLREQWGPIGINSWYRPKAVNREIGGASQSRHVHGDAVDAVLLNPKLRSAFERVMLKEWKGGVGLGVAAGKGYTHLDLGPRRFWDY